MPGLTSNSWPRTVTCWCPAVTNLAIVKNVSSLRKTTASTVPSSVVSGSPATVLGYPADMVRTLALVGIFAFACSHDSGGIAAGDYAAQAAQALCDYEVRCGLFADPMS